jgi:hypothetical protein
VHTNSVLQKDQALSALSAQLQAATTSLADQALATKKA